MHAKYEVPISYGSKVIAKVKVDNRQTNRHTDSKAGTVQDFHGSVRFRFSYPRFDFIRIGSVSVFNTIKLQDLGLT